MNMGEALAGAGVQARAQAQTQTEFGSFLAAVTSHKTMSVHSVGCLIL